MNRYHNKYHAANHHTIPVSGDPDSAHDPIASQSDPFMGNFHLANDLIVSGDIIMHGDIDLIGYAFQNSTASAVSAGVIRFATPVEVAVGINTTTAVSPRDLDVLSTVSFTHALSSTAHTDIEITTPLSGEVLSYDATDAVWKNTVPVGIDVPLATDEESLSTSLTGVAVTPQQLQSVIKRYKPIFINGDVSISGQSVYLGGNIIVSGDSVIEGTMLFSKYLQQQWTGTGNGAVLTTFYGLKIFQYNGITWVQY